MVRLLQMWHRWKFLLRRSQMDKDLAEEMRLHLELKAQELRETGLSEKEARQAASREFGNALLLKEVSRELWGWTRVECTIKDIRYGFRMLVKNPGFTIVAVLTLALGIGANTAIFTIVNAFLLRALPFDRPNQLVHIWQTDAHHEFGDMLRVSPATFLDWRDQAKSFEDLGTYYYGGHNDTTGQIPKRVGVGWVTVNLPALLGVQPILGRTFLPDEAQPGNDKVVLLSHRYWQGNLNSDPKALGKAIKLDGENYRVIGVMPKSFVFPFGGVQIWTPLSLSRDEAARADRGPLLVIGRLKKNTTIEQAQAEMTNIARRLEESYPLANKGVGARVVPLRQALLFFYDQAQFLLLALFLGTGAVLLIVCTNLGTLLVARAADRCREVAIRSALGASSLRVIRQLLTESSLLAISGGLLAALFTAWIFRLVAPAFPEDLYHVGDVSVDSRVLIFTLGISMLAVFFFGLAPALLAARTSLAEVLKGGGKGVGAGWRSRHLHNILVVVQFGLGMILLAGAFFSIRLFLQQQRVDPGFSSANVLTLEIETPQSSYADPTRINQFYGEVLGRLRRLPGVKSAAAVYPLPMNFEMDLAEYQVVGKTPPPSNAKLSATRFSVTSAYFFTMQIPLLRGNVFDDRSVSGSPPVVMINQVLARQNWPNEDPIGRQIRLYNADQSNNLATVVGVVGDTKDYLMHEKLRPQIYFPQLQSSTRRRFLVMRTEIDPLALVPSVRNEIQKLDKDIPISEIRPMQQVVFQALSPLALGAAVFGLLGIGALLLAAMGIYGVLSYALRQRSHEIGVRLALGAQKKQILMLILRQGARLAGAGSVFGLAGTLALMQLSRSWLVENPVWDPFVLFGTTALLAVTALLACYVPARRAMKVDPMVTLRYE